MTRNQFCSALLVALSIPTAFAQNEGQGRVRARWDFKFRKFPIAAWWGPSATDAEMKLYREAGFNVVMGGRYMQLGDYGDADKGTQELDLAKKYGLGLLFDTYTKNEHPWGGIKDSGYDPHPNHHASSLRELEWLYKKIGGHPALIGFMIGDDQGTVSPRTKACTDFLFKQEGPKLIPWLCGWIPPANLAENNNPVSDPQIYPTLYSWDQSAEELAGSYAATYYQMSRQCQEHGVMFWPMFNSGSSAPDGNPADIGGPLPSDSLVRFPAYAALAYGAEGIFYFCYSGGNIEKTGPFSSPDDAKNALTRQYPVVKRINERIAAWGPLVLGRTSTGLFGTAFPSSADGSQRAGASKQGLLQPATGKLIESISSNVLVGILTKRGRRPLAMVVNCETSKGFGDLRDRQVSIHFNQAVTGVRVLEGKASRTVHGNEVTLTLEPGSGQMLELEGKKAAELCTAASIGG